MALGLVALILASPAFGQEKKAKSEPVRFETADGVELHGKFWPGEKGHKSPTAILLHKFGGKSSDDGWDSLGDALQKAGFAVLSFDFRGHGKSVTIDGNSFLNPNPKFRHNYDAFRVRPPIGKPPTSIAYAQFKAGYEAHLVDDLIAARMFLERKNDSKDCNVSNLVLIGAEDGATVGLMWLAAELKRFRINMVDGLGRPTSVAKKSEGKDVIACIWLNLNGKIGKYNVPTTQLNNWLREAGKTEKIPMAFIYGKNDDKGDKAALAYVRTIRGPKYDRKAKPSDGDELKATGDYGVPGTNLVGSKLLRSSLNTEKWIVKEYLEGAILEKYGGNEWTERKPADNAYGWTLGTNRWQMGKIPNEKHLSPLPLGIVGLTRN